MRAYEPGERWRASGSAVLDADGDMRARTTAGVTRVDEALARLIAESPERDELLREIEEWIGDLESEEPDDMAARDSLLSRIRATLARTEDR